MRFNWGHGLLIAIIVCTGGILLLLYLSSRQKIDLVTDDYYPKELAYEEQIIKLKNTNTLPTRVKILSQDDSIFICFPRVVDHEDSVKGEIWFYFPADKAMDRKMSIKLNKHFTQVVDREEFRKGKYTVLIDWAAGDKPYFQREVLFLNPD